jgi:molybdopterin-guanine dinucleotide biosynthesis protein A
MLDARVVNTLGAYLDNGGRSARGWLDLLDTVDVDCADLRTELRDIDTPDALSEGRVIP